MKTLAALVFVILALPTSTHASDSTATIQQRIAVLYQRAMSGDAKAQFQLASLYETGQRGLEKDIALAVSWYEEAAHNGLKMATFRLRMLSNEQ